MWPSGSKPDKRHISFLLHFTASSILYEYLWLLFSSFDFKMTDILWIFQYSVVWVMFLCSQEESGRSVAAGLQFSFRGNETQGGLPRRLVRANQFAQLKIQNFFLLFSPLLLIFSECSWWELLVSLNVHDESSYSCFKLRRTSEANSRQFAVLALLETAPPVKFACGCSTVARHLQ